MVISPYEAPLQSNLSTLVIHRVLCRLIYSIADYLGDFKKVQDDYSENERKLVYAVADFDHYVQPFLAKENEWNLGTDHRLSDNHVVEINAGGKCTVTLSTLSYAKVLFDSNNANSDAQNTAASLYYYHKWALANNQS